jgi:uncharacterized membrane protein
MRRMLARHMRMIDVRLMALLQNGTAFLAPTSLIAIGGALTLLRAADEIEAVVVDRGVRTCRAIPPRPRRSGWRAPP